MDHHQVTNVLLGIIVLFLFFMLLFMWSAYSTINQAKNTVTELTQKAMLGLQRAGQAAAVAAPKIFEEIQKKIPAEAKPVVEAILGHVNNAVASVAAQAPLAASAAGSGFGSFFRP